MAPTYYWVFVLLKKHIYISCKNHVYSKDSTDTLGTLTLGRPENENMKNENYANKIP